MSDLRSRIEALLPTQALADGHCHASVTDEDGDEDACGQPAEHWVIFDPETGSQRAWPVCYLHASESYSGMVADEWVDVLTEARAALASDWLARRDAQMQARALRDAADDVRRIRTEGLRTGETHGPYTESFERWLRDRADRVDGENGGGE